MKLCDVKVGVKGQGSDHPWSCLLRQHCHKNSFVSPASSAPISSATDAEHFLQTVGTLWKFLGVLIRWHPALVVPRCQLADGRNWHVARSAGRISCHHGDRLAWLAGTVAQYGSLPRMFSLIL